MKSIRLLFFFLLFFPLQNLSAQLYDMIPVSDPVLEDLRYLAMASGKPLVSFTPPFSLHEIEQFINSLDEANLPAPAQEAYQRVIKRLNPKTNLNLSGDYFALLININSTIEIKTRFDTDVSWYPHYSRIPAFISTPVRFNFSNMVQLYIEPSINVNPDYYDQTGIFSLNIPFDYYDYDANMPLRAYITAGGPWWNFQLGRDRLFWGTGNMGSLSFSDNASFSDFARLSVFSQFIKYSLVINQMPLTLDDTIYDRPFIDENSLRHTTQRYFYLHRMDFRFFGKISLGIMEGIMAANSAIELRFLNPFVVFHSFFSWSDYDYWSEMPETGSMVGSFFSVELNWNIIKNFSIYGQMVMNEFSTSDEANNSTDLPPNAFGYIAGLQYAHSFNTWASVFFLEAIYTDPFLYVLSSPFCSFIQMRRYAAMHYYFIGYPRDNFTCTLGGRFFNNDSLSISGHISWFVQGQRGIKWDWEKGQDAYNARTPTGTAESKIIASFGANWKPLSFLTINGVLTGIYSQNNNHNSNSNKFGGQAELSVSFSY